MKNKIVVVLIFSTLLLLGACFKFPAECTQLWEDDLSDLSAFSSFSDENGWYFVDSSGEYLRVYNEKDYFYLHTDRDPLFITRVTDTNLDALVQIQVSLNDGNKLILNYNAKRNKFYKTYDLDPSIGNLIIVGLDGEIKPVIEREKLRVETICYPDGETVALDSSINVKKIEMRNKYK